MSQIHNLTTTMWACELNDVYVSADADVSVRIVVNDADGVTRFDNVSTYTPVAGKVEFGELSRLVNQAILLSDEVKSGISAAESSRTPVANITISLPEEEISATAQVYYYNGYYREGVGDMSEFPMQIDAVRVTPSQRFWVWVPTMGTATRKVTARVVYAYNGMRREETFEIQTYTDHTSAYAFLDCSLAALFSGRLSPAVWSSAKIHQYDILLWTDGEMTDQINVTVDHNHYPSCLEFGFLNSFGVPEVIALHGEDEEEHKMEADFGYSQWRYTRLDEEFWVEHKTNSGWITRKEKARALELHRSPEVVLFASTIIPVTITDIDASFLLAKTKPESIDIKWRIADRRDIYEVDTATSMAGHGVFDETFSTAFD